MKFTIRERKKEKDTYYFGDLKPGEFFLDSDEDLALKIVEPPSNYFNAILIETTELYCYDDTDNVTPVDYELNIYREV